jgi:hypothetical protein
MYLFKWIFEHWSAVGYIALIWVGPVAIVYFSSKLFNRRLSS